MTGFSLDLTEEAERIVAEWAKTAADPEFLHRKEKPFQGQFLDQVFGTVLGYTHAVGHLDDYNLDVETSSRQTPGGRTPDGALGFFGAEKDITRAVIELKPPAVDLDLKQKGRDGGLTPVEQGFGYAPKFDGVAWVIVSNFIDIRLYHATRGQGYCHIFHVDELTDRQKLAELVFLLHKDRLISERSGDSLIERLVKETNVAEEKITKEFYLFYKGVRGRLFDQLVRDNPAPAGVEASDHAVRLLERAQKILDRVLFICFCEDTGLLPPGIIHKAIKEADQTGFVQRSRWEYLTGLFHAVDQGNEPLQIHGYNGGLFAEDPALDGLSIPDAMLDDFLRLSDYDFATDLNVNILGHIFEQSISDIEAMQADIRGETSDAKGGKRKKEGVFYTPEYITQFIVRQTVGRWLEARYAEIEAEIQPDRVRGKNKKRDAYISLWFQYQEALRNIKILDPACGSGAFLVAALEYLQAEYARAAREIEALKGHSELFDLDRHILQQNLFGVDLNPESVEITRLSLWLKTANQNKPLVNLDQNIRCGNSIIDPSVDVAAEAFAALPEDVRARAFDWRCSISQYLCSFRCLNK